MLWNIYLYCESLGKGIVSTVEADNKWNAEALALSMHPGHVIYNPDIHGC